VIFVAGFAVRALQGSGLLLSKAFLAATFYFTASSVYASAQVTAASINLCADQYLLLLAEDKQILSLSNLSHREAGSYFFEQARQYPVNKGDAEKILTLNPDVVIVGQYSSVHTVNLLQEVGLRVETLPIANNLDTLFSNIQRVAGWIGHKQAGDKIVTELQNRIAALEVAALPRPVAAVYDPNGYTSGANSLRGEMMELAGWENAASSAGIESYGKLTLEEIIHLAPDAFSYFVANQITSCTHRAGCRRQPGPVWRGDAGIIA